MSSTEIRIKPLGWQDAPASERFELSDMDHTMPKIYVQIAEIFELPEGSDKQVIIDSVSKGLEFALSQFPALAGTIHMDETNGRMWVTKKKDSSVGLYVKTADDDVSDLPSFDYLNQHDFPVHILDGHRLLPKVVTEKQLFSPLGHNADDQTITSTFQINFIRGGVILAAAIHHNCSDGTGCNGFLSTWAQSSAAARNGAPFKPIDKESLNRERLSAAKPDSARWETLDGKYPILKDLGGPPPPPPADFKMPPLKIRLWHIPKSSASRLKQDIGSELGDAWISTYDAIIALLWKSVTRSKIPLLKPDLEDEVILAYGMNVRSRMEPPLADCYLGNVVALPSTEPRPIKAILADGSLSEMALAVRQATQSIDHNYVAGVTEWVAGLEDRRWITINMRSFLGMDLAATSWQAMTPYQDHDFGFGLPRALRWPHPQFEGYVFILPSRANVKVDGDASDEGLEAIVCLEESCHDRLLQDEELLRYAQPRGHEA
ncbi:hypothetical protein PFICI_08786 [Pestalotiopsis fici W106-1]|uniref:Trichothecene 3-O-acetyltransferase n=1 Tax=Pestalotiopsis fici (strain W106-1 / CGMCC3.15140) TaxID=1229662 RepID=W3WYI0_PESFW|nr:uncharacterized protein PFICI_08786 [Pestalotiopsis fici W106-1]ETS78933.1 hypothetical protein PFICI_08786 [Pestalotiopsis fici W106-1]